MNDGRATGSAETSTLDALYAPPPSRPASGGVVYRTERALWAGYGLGWAAIAFTFLWVVVAFPLFVRFTSITVGATARAVWLALLVLPTLALGAYFVLRRQWRRLAGMVLAWATAIALGALLAAMLLGMDGGFVD